MFFSLRPLLSPVHSLSSPLLPPSQQQQQKPSIDRKGVYVELGAKSPAFCASSELSVARVERAADFVQPGDAREFVVLREDQRSGELQLSIRRAEEALVWRRLRQSLEEGAAVEGLVTSFNAAGLMVDVQGQKGFVPGSHVPNNVLPEDLVGRRLSLKLLEVDEERQRLVLSNRRRASSSGGRTFRVGAFRSFLEPPPCSPLVFLLGATPSEKKGKNSLSSFFSLFLSLFPRQQRQKKIGDVVVGTVAAVQVYGAFVDLGGGVNGELTEKVSLLLRSSFSFSSSSLRGREAKNKTKAHSISPPPPL